MNNPYQNVHVLPSFSTNFHVQTKPLYLDINVADTSVYLTELSTKAGRY